LLRVRAVLAVATDARVFVKRACKLPRHPDAKLPKAKKVKGGITNAEDAAYSSSRVSKAVKKARQFVATKVKEQQQQQQQQQEKQQRQQGQAQREEEEEHPHHNNRRLSTSSNRRNTTNTTRRNTNSGKTAPHRATGLAVTPKPKMRSSKTERRNFTKRSKRGRSRRRKQKQCKQSSRSREKRPGW